MYTGSLNGNGGTDWHIGMCSVDFCWKRITLTHPRPTSGMMSGALRLPLNGNTQQINETDFYYSGIYVEDSGPTTQP